MSRTTATNQPDQTEKQTEDQGVCYAVIVAAGRGERAGVENGPKQYRRLGGKAVLAHTASAFLNHPKIDGVICVIHADDGDLYTSAMASLGDHGKLLPPCTGGATRQQSVFAGLKALEALAPDHVLIHDAARPFVDANTVSRTRAALDTHAAVLPVLAVTDTLKRGDAEGRVEATVDRTNLFAAQTPQAFNFPIILDAHKAAAARDDINFTDDAALAEWAYIPVHLVEGGARNTKLTTVADMSEAERLMDTMVPDIRVGHGYDTHQQVSGDHVWLCGVRLDHTHGLSGHSDADVGLHALTDALLSAICDGDIGEHFPPSDPQWKGARSDTFLRFASERVRRAGGTITHIDVTLICEAPKIGPHRDRMRAAISDIADLPTDRVAVKATTNEQIGFVGRGEGIVALATATVVMGHQAK
ncbi:MAG: bifunctional 2-C-methyl-D-erythritol 4-phosphate cytidylyltransferase/2-C-methyl-D-erythritol 2,4-cyclodiphosphate synthase [Pseudomonadota bacterium]